jgi:putative phage-type endonuclease
VTTNVAAGRRVTPTAYRLLPADAGRDEWLAARRTGVGSSDVAAILGLSERRTPLHVWHDKRGALVDEQTEPMLWGTLLEDTVAREWARRNRSVIQRVGLVANETTPWMLATLDRRVAECPLNRKTREACALEIKCRNAFTAHRWRSDVPDDVLAQVIWQLDVTGYDHIHVAVLIGGNDYRQTVVRRDEQLSAYVAREVAAFRDDHLLTSIPPDWDLDRADALNGLDAALHPDRTGSHELGLTELGDVMEYAAASAAKSAAERRLKAARAVLAKLAAGSRHVTFGDQLAYEFAPVTRSTANLDALAEQYPDAYAACVTDKTHYQIRVAPEYRAMGAPDDDR